ncbi:MBL fold metallo-hydrolase [Lysinibacter cavernae]|uniref:Glyoxylase-like metal-dependent hydrolase (Beta-lactamase superfamily II) n=1 Tax=Lysinibacter cavernae TaxID=1640652 RepID=A0A7X5R3A7_9MICO|nr:MBL fold metallo-hydrolase [Lysinibacter cavernae]NIH54747.1 glyoxylase-like metal-dependent hydrolase (beta-lactamase superfamily II) [Lysinibacter cavernae]
MNERTRIQNLVTSGTFSLDGGTWDVDNNVWVVGDDSEVIVIDPAHDPAAIAEVVDGRRVKAILLTHAHDDHIRSVGGFRALTGAPVYLNPADRMLWDEVYSTELPDHPIFDGDRFEVGGAHLTALATPGHSPGSTCFYSGELGALFSGDTLFNGGPGATGRSHSNFDTIIVSITEKLLPLPEDTVVYTGHGETTTIGDESPHLEEWITRGH